MTPPERLLTVSEAAEILSTSERFPRRPDRRTPHPLRPGRTPRRHPGIRTPRVHRGRARRAHHHNQEKGRLMPNNKGRRRRFGAVRSLPSGQFQARYKGPDGTMHAADRTFPTQTDAEVWLSVKEAESSAATGLIPTSARCYSEVRGRLDRGKAQPAAQDGQALLLPAPGPPVPRTRRHGHSTDQRRHRPNMAQEAARRRSQRGHDR